MKNDNTQQQTAIVTGASSGIGLGLTQVLLAQGYRVVANSRTISKSKDLNPSDQLVLVDGNIVSKETAVRVADAALKHFGRIDLLVNNAGIFIPKPFTDYTVEDFETMVSTNVASFFYMTQQVIPAMRKQKSGHIVNISTTMVDQPIAGVPSGLPSLTKAGMQAVTKELAMEYAGDGIRVNTVAPGVVNTPMHANDDHEFLKKLHPIRRLAEIPELVDAVLYLTSATFVTGEVLHIDGGAHAGKW
jgi:NAD(P)-dependent dehydrogenase (short-subunit alcohol dehydrogenase family)